MKYLFLDDIRIPSEVGNYIYSEPMYRLEEWYIVRDYVNFTYIIESQGLPEVISFDHDLGEDVAIINREFMSKRKARAIKRESKSGYDCAKWLVEYCQDRNLPLPKCYVHSMNPVGAENIKNLLNNFKKMQNPQQLS